MPGQPNAIEKRISVLKDEWNRFASQPEPRLLRWLISDEDLGILDLFLRLQSEGDIEGVPDLFVRLRSPFTRPSEYPTLLVKEFEEYYRANQPGLAEAGVSDSWHPPPSSAGPLAFLNCIASFHRHYEKDLVHVAAILEPSVISDSTQWQSWLWHLLHLNPPEHVRFAVIDPAGSPRLTALAETLPQAVTTASPDLDTAGAVRELAASAGGNGPGGEFRRLFIDLSQMEGTGATHAWSQKSAAALAICDREKWPALAVVIHMMTATRHLKAGNHTDAIFSYHDAGVQAALAAISGDPSAAKLTLQAKLGEASAYVSAGRFAEAANSYLHSAPLAEQAQDTLLTLECWRMAAYCHEQTGTVDHAWQEGWQALAVAESLDSALRPNSTLPYVGECLLRLAANDPRAQQQVRERLQSLMGPGWQHRA